MATLTVRDVDDGQYERLVEQAKAKGRSVSAEVRRLIAEHDERQRKSRLVEEFIDWTRANAMPLPEGYSDSLQLLREERDNW